MPTPRPSFDIVHLAHTTFPEDPRPRREAMVAAEQGARVAVVVFRPDERVPAVGRYGPLRVIRLPGRKQRGSAAGYLLDYLDFLIRARALIRDHPRFRQTKIIHVHTLPDFLIGATGPARRRGARVILDLHELFPEFTEARFGGWRGRIAAAVARRLERWSRARADVTLTVNASAREQFAGRPARPEERILVIHNFTDPDEFGQERVGGGAASDPLRLVYHGTVTPMYGLDLAVEAVAGAGRLGVDVSLDVFGSGPAVTAVEALAVKLGVAQRVRLRGVRPFRELREILPTYHAGFVPTRLDVMTRFSLSTKLLEYVHLGIPVIAPAIPTYRAYFPGDCLWYFTPNDATDAARTIAAFRAATPEDRIRRIHCAQREAGQRIDVAADRSALLNLYVELLRP